MHTRIHATTDAEAALDAFRAEFPAESRSHGARNVTPDEMPRVFRELLVHNEHMTETLRSHHGADIRLNVLWESVNSDCYRRYITLALASTGRVVEVGMVRIGLAYVPEEVRRRIRGGEVPLGDLLIGADVLRRIEPKWYFKFDRPDAIVSAFGDNEIDAAYGRLGTIYCDHAPAIELLEVVTDHWIGK